MSAPRPFDWVAEAGMLRGALMAADVLLTGGTPPEHVLQIIRKEIDESQRRLDDHFAASQARQADSVALVAIEA